MREVDRFRIRTLDAFFVRLAHLFALDLGLPSDWTIVEEAEDLALRRDAVARALAVAERGAFLEPLRGYRAIRDEVPLGEHLVPFGQARQVTDGDDVVVGTCMKILRAGLEGSS